MAILKTADMEAYSEKTVVSNSLFSVLAQVVYTKMHGNIQMSVVLLHRVLFKIQDFSKNIINLN